MSLVKYSEFINESKIYELLLESKVVYSKKLVNLLTKMKSNKLASELLNLYSTDVDGLVQNYIDITDEKDSVSFTPDRKVQELIKDKPETWEVIETGRYLTNSNRNDKIFERLGYDKEKYGCWSPDRGAIGTILSETVSQQSGNIYVMFQEYGVSTPRVGVINKTAVQESEDVENMKVWSTSRNPIKIGRLIRAILTKAKVTFTDKDIEDFTNTYKATYDFMKDVLKQFDVIQGNKIAYWYEKDNYVSGGGTLNNSCMADVDTEDYFDIYCYNPQVSLVILYSDDGKIEGEKYTSNKIKGRAILWDANINGKEGKFMDRVYTRFDSDVDLFKQFAEKNGWWYKKSQSMEPSESITNGSESASNPNIIVKLKDGTWDYYPYCDTMCYLDTGDDTLTNREVGDRMLRDTGGGFDDM
jgi:hypothetical protein